MKSFIKVTAFAVTIFFFFSCSPKSKKQNEKELKVHEAALQTYKILKEQEDKNILEIMDILSLEERLAQIFLINLENDDKFLPVEWYEKPFVKITEYTDSSGEKKYMSSESKRTLAPGFYIFFGYNIADNPEQIIRFTDSILEEAKENYLVPPFMSIDAEGGWVNRLRKVGGPLPECARVSECLNPVQSYALYSASAKQLKSLGFNINLAPVSEIDSQNNHEFLDGRSFGNFDQVVDYSTFCIDAYQNNGVMTVVKHFPGNTNVDPHLGLPKIDMTDEDFETTIKCFSKVLQAKPDAVLMSHAIVESKDKTPACLSKFWINDVLRGQLKYDGLIFSDDIFMAALIENGYKPEKASRMAIEAGINCIMISEKKFGHWMKLIKKNYLEDENIRKKIDESVYRVLKLKLKYGLISRENFSPERRYADCLDFSKETEKASVESRAEIFNQNKNYATDLYKKYFYETADELEKRCVNIK
ncbi:MAG: glycoside hydrolase family 3 protein [Treponema sp.]|nr:glycoside hydrolase family 3 protein [Candidatus Treponema merdequi]